MIRYLYLSKNGSRVIGLIGEGVLKFYDKSSDDPKIIQLKKPLTGVGSFRRALLDLFKDENIPFASIEVKFS